MDAELSLQHSLLPTSQLHDRFAAFCTAMARASSPARLKRPLRPSFRFRRWRCNLHGLPWPPATKVSLLTLEASATQHATLPL